MFGGLSLGGSSTAPQQGAAGVDLLGGLGGTSHAAPSGNGGGAGGGDLFGGLAVGSGAAPAAKAGPAAGLSLDADLFGGAAGSPAQPIQPRVRLHCPLEGVCSWNIRCSVSGHAHKPELACTYSPWVSPGI
jgi:hypothetical protein